MNPPEIATLSLFGVCLASGLVMPIPEDVAILSAGWAVREGRMGLAAAFAGAFAGTLVRDMLAFVLGRFAGERLWGLAGRIFGAARLDAGRARFDRAAGQTVFLTRFAVGMRAPLYFVSGTLRFPFRRFVVLDTLGLCVTTPILLWIGAESGPAAAEWIVAVLPHQRLVVAGALALLVISGLVWRRSRRGDAAS